MKNENELGKWKMKKSWLFKAHKELFIFHLNLQEMVLISVGKIYKYFKMHGVVLLEWDCMLDWLDNGSFVGELIIQKNWMWKHKLYASQG